jgi:hypothetical protein
VFFIVGLAAWTADAFDFHALSIQTVKLADYYGKWWQFAKSLE